MGTFWFYERLSERQSSVIIHGGWCRACNEGKGYQQRVHNRRRPELQPSGRWHGPYATNIEAIAAAQRILAGSVRRVRSCGLCLDRDFEAPIRRRLPWNRSLQVKFWLQMTREGTVTAHASTCPCLRETTTMLKRASVAREGNWSGPYDRLAIAISKAEEWIEAEPRRRLRQCMKCGWNRRLAQLDDLLATAFDCKMVGVGPTPLGHINTTDRHIICLECGKGRKLLERHLLQAHQITPAQYRQKWRLPADYPMVPWGHLKQVSRKARDVALTKLRAKSEVGFCQLYPDVSREDA